MKVLRQNDPRWANDKLGVSRLTVDRWGCALTSLVNLANALGVNKKGLTPGDIAHDVACFTDSNYKGGPGLILWDKVCKLIGDIQYVGSQVGEHPETIAAAIKDPTRGVILNVNGGAHFVLGWSNPWFGKDFRIADPLDGKVVGAKARWHNIVGARYFKMI